MRFPAAVGRARAALRHAAETGTRTGGREGVSVVWVAGELGLGENAARVALSHLLATGEAIRERADLDRKTWLYRLADHRPTTTDQGDPA